MEWPLLRLVIAFVLIIASASEAAILTTCNLPWKLPVTQSADILVGTKCTWIWQDSFPHCVQGLSGPQHFQSPTTSRQGTRFSFTFTKPGTYTYDCCVHGSEMRGTLVVHPKAAPSPPPPHKCRPACGARCWGPDGCRGTCPLPPSGRGNTIAKCTQCCAAAQRDRRAACACYRGCRRIPAAKLKC